MKFTGALLRESGKPCAYCKRVMDANDYDLMPTRDHVQPRSRGGKVTVWACRTCNRIKADMSLGQWLDFMAAFPKWWHGVPKKKRTAIMENGTLAVIPLVETKMILLHGKKAWREWKAAQAVEADNWEARKVANINA